MTSSSIAWAQEVKVGVAGELVGVALYNPTAGPLTFWVDRGRGWRTGPHDFEIETVIGPSGAWNLIAVDFARLNFNVGDYFAFGVRGRGGNTQFGGNFSTPYLYGQLFLNGSAFGSGSLAFRTFLAAAETPSLEVTTLADVVNSTDGQSSLCEALTYAAQLSGPSTVTFTPALTAGGPATITLSTTGDTTVGPSALRITTTVTIRGPAGPTGITLNAGFSQRLFEVGTGGNLTLESLALSGGRVFGVNGESGGGGGEAGLGGSVYNRGALVVRNSTLVDNLAIGGFGGDGDVMVAQVIAEVADLAVARRESVEIRGAKTSTGSASVQYPHAVELLCHAARKGRQSHPRHGHAGAVELIQQRNRRGHPGWCAGPYAQVRRPFHRVVQQRTQATAEGEVDPGCRLASNNRRQRKRLRIGTRRVRSKGEFRRAVCPIAIGVRCRLGGEVGPVRLLPVVEEAVLVGVGGLGRLEQQRLESRPVCRHREVVGIEVVDGSDSVPRVQDAHVAGVHLPIAPDVVGDGVLEPRQPAGGCDQRTPCCVRHIVDAQDLDVQIRGRRPEILLDGLEVSKLDTTVPSARRGEVDPRHLEQVIARRNRLRVARGAGVDIDEPGVRHGSRRERRIRSHCEQRPR